MSISRHRPFVRWWWFGGALEREEIAFELEAMAEAGIGGVEIQPVYPLGTGRGNEPRNLVWLSDEFLEMLRFAAEKAESLDMTTDLTLGSGWPFGGPHIPKRLAARRLRYDYWDIEEGETWSLEEHPLEEDETPISLLAAPISAGLIDFESIVAIDGSEWTAPAGRWRVMRYASSYTRMMVKRATVGSEGWVADHFSREAMELHFREVGDRLVQATRGKVRCFFSDSWEVFGSNWTGDFTSQFKRQRGYDIVDYLPALDNYVKDLSPWVRYDYHRTLSELVLESYIVPMREWCHCNGSFSRVQAHGTTPADILKCYGESDVPECETGGWADGSGIGRTPKFASSAAHLYGRSEVSCETYTHLRRPRFQVTPRMLKVAADRIYCHGVNHLVYHGYSYSPRRLGSPGWVFYASTMFNHNNPWWPYARHLNRHNQLLSRELHRGSPTADVLLYSSLADVWCRKGTETRPSTLSRLSSQLGKLPETVWSAGYDFEIANDEILEKTRIEGDKIAVADLEFSILLVPAIDYIPLRTMEKLHQIVLKGGRVVFLDRNPRWTPGEPSGAKALERLVLEMREAQKNLHSIDLVQGEADIQGVLRATVPPDVQLPHPDPEIIFIHRRHGEEDIYLLSNSGGAQKAMEIGFRVRGPVPWEVDTESGECSEACVYRREAERTFLRVCIGPFGSKLLRFTKGSEGIHLSWSGFPTHRRTNGKLMGIAYEPGQYEVVDGNGRATVLQVGGIPERIPVSSWTISPESTGVPRSLPRLASWTEIDEFKHYSGKATYESEFSLNRAHLDSGIGLELDLGEVREVATVYINQRKAGELWTPPYTIDIREFVKEGTNSLKVEVTNLLINGVLGLPDPDYRHVEEMYGRRFPDPRERTECHLQPSGLLGPVEIKAYRPVEIGP